MPLSPVLCVFGTGSDVGKSWITTGLCRIFERAGVRVAPYKAQNMSNNAGVTPEGGEMGRAQIVQAEACRLPPHVDMNPLLLKPNTDTGAQIVLLGQVVGNTEAREYFSGGMEQRRAPVLAALDRLRRDYELVVVEGAGSCAEVNLRDRDLVNMPVAHHADAPVILVADINKGGVFAQVVGTLEVLSDADRARIQGVIINRFRGDASLFEDGRAWLEQRTGLPILGVVPWLWEARIESEDGLQADVQIDPPPPTHRDQVHVAVIRLPHIANFTDVDALQRHGVVVHYLGRPRPLAPYDLVILPGTKNTRGDLAWMRHTGWDAVLGAYTGKILGLCGGYQLLGRTIADPAGVEGEPGTSDGLGYLPVDTVLERQKTTRLTAAELLIQGRAVPVEGYEIHVGRTTGDAPPALRLSEGTDGAWSADGRVCGTYLHGLLDNAAAVRAIGAWCRPDLAMEGDLESAWDYRQRQYDLLAEHLEANLDLERLFALVGR